MAKVDQQKLYVILAGWAGAQHIGSYIELSTEYEKTTGDWIDHHLGWARPLGVLNNTIYDAWGAPAITRVVCRQGTDDPGPGFYDCAPNAASGMNLNKIKRDVFAYTWPPKLP